MRLKLQILLLLSLLILILFILTPNLSSLSALTTLGTEDFIEYWSAFQLIIKKQNPYDPTLMQELQLSLGRLSEFPLMMWNPPWTVLPLFALGPLAQVDFPTAATNWFYINLFILLPTLIVSIYFLIRQESRLLLFTIPLIGIFMPNIVAITVGQVSLLIACTTALLLLSLKTRRDTLSGIALALLSIKPHLVYLLLLAIGWDLLKNKRKKVIFTFIGSIALLIGTTFVISPDSIAQFLYGPPESAQPFIRIADWEVGTPVAWLRSVLLSLTGSYAAWPIIVVPCISAIAAVIWLFKLRRPLDWRDDGAMLITLSLLTSPFGWLFDHALLSIPLGLLMSLALKSPLRGLYLLLLALLLVVPWLQPEFGYSSHSHYAWLSLAVLILTVVLGKNKARDLIRDVPRP